MEIIDLTEYQVGVPVEKTAFSQRWLIDKSGNYCFTSYVDPAHAMSEITYSRFCDSMNLLCAKAQWGQNLNLPRAPKYISVSCYDSSWAPIDEVIRGEYHVQYADKTTWETHRMLAYLFQFPYHEFDGMGYIEEDGSFVKANNGHLFHSLGLKQVLNKKQHKPFLHEVSLENLLEFTSLSNQDKKILRQMSELTDSELESYVQMPSDWSHALVGQSYLMKRLKVARKVSVDFVESNR